MDNIYNMAKKLDEIDKKILNQLLVDAKIPNYNKLGKALDLIPQTVHNRLKRLTRGGIIQGFVPVLDLKKLGYTITAIIQVSAEKGQTATLIEKYIHHKNVLAIYDVLGPHDIMLIVKFRSTEELEKFIKEFQIKNSEVRNTNTISVLSVQKEWMTPNPIE